MTKKYICMLLFCLNTWGPLFSQTPDGATTSANNLTQHKQLAAKYLSERHPVQAIIELREVIKIDPQDIEAQANLGVLLFFQGAFQESIPYLKLASAARPELLKIRALLGMAEQRTGDSHDACADLEAVFPLLQDEKLKMDVGADLIDNYTRSDDLAKAAEVNEALLKLKPTDPGLLYTEYRLHHDLGVRALLQLSMAAPGSAQLHQAMAHELERDHDQQGVIRNLREALAADPKLPGVHFELAEALHSSDDQRQRAESLGEYKLAVQTAPRDPEALSRLADIDLEQGDLVNSEELYKQALAVQPDFADAKIGLANLLLQKDNVSGAQKQLEEVLVTDPTNVLAHYRLSSVYRRLKRPEDVRRQLELYQRYKSEREQIKSLYQGMRSEEPPQE